MDTQDKPQHMTERDYQAVLKHQIARSSHDGKLQVKDTLLLPSYRASKLHSYLNEDEMRDVKTRRRAFCHKVAPLDCRTQYGRHRWPADHEHRRSSGINVGYCCRLLAA